MKKNYDGALILGVAAFLVIGAVSLIIRNGWKDAVHEGAAYLSGLCLLLSLGSALAGGGARSLGEHPATEYKVHDGAGMPLEWALSTLSSSWATWKRRINGCGELPSVPLRALLFCTSITRSEDQWRSGVPRLSHNQEIKSK